MKKIIRVMECCDYKKTYGYLEIEDVPAYEVQKKIYQIKNDANFQQECPDWRVTDVFERFPADWKWNFIADDGSEVEI